VIQILAQRPQEPSPPPSIRHAQAEHGASSTVRSEDPAQPAGPRQSEGHAGVSRTGATTRRRSAVCRKQGEQTRRAVEPEAKNSEKNGLYPLRSSHSPPPTQTTPARRSYPVRSRTSAPGPSGRYRRSGGLAGPGRRRRWG